MFLALCLIVLVGAALGLAILFLGAALSDWLDRKYKEWNP